MAEPLPEFFPWLDRKKRQVVKDIALALEAPETIGPNIWAAAKDLARVAGLAPSEAQEARHERLKSVMYKESPEGKQDLKDMMVEMAGSFGPGVLGTLRSGGPRNLLLTHGGKLSTPEGGALKELLHPSFAITHETDPRNNFAGSYLIPRIGAFDPAYSPSTLFNRDAYIARANTYPGGMNPTPWERIESRGLLPSPKTEGFSNWYELADPRQGIEGMSYRSIPSWKEPVARGSHDTAIFSSPAFRSFAEYERSPAGAGTLGKGDPEAGWSQGFERDYLAWAQNKFPADYNYDKKWLTHLREFAGKGDKEAQRLLRSARTAPSEYGELKVSGPVPITGDRFAGAILSSRDEHIAKILRQRGLDVSSIYDIDAGRPEQLFKAIDEIQRGAFPVKEQSLRVSAGWDPQAAVPEAPQFKIEAGETSAAGSRGGDDSLHAAAFKTASEHMESGMDYAVPFDWKGNKFFINEYGEVYAAGGGGTPLLTILDSADGMLIPPPGSSKPKFDPEALAENTKKFAEHSAATSFVPEHQQVMEKAKAGFKTTQTHGGNNAFMHNGKHFMVKPDGSVHILHEGSYQPYSKIGGPGAKPGSIVGSDLPVLKKAKSLYGLAPWGPNEPPALFMVGGESYHLQPNGDILHKDTWIGNISEVGGPSPKDWVQTGKKPNPAAVQQDLADMHGEMPAPFSPEFAALAATLPTKAGQPLQSPVHMAADLVQNTTPFSGFKPFEQGGMQWRVDSAGNLEAMYHGKWNPEGNIFKKPGLSPAAGSSGDIPQ